MSRHHTLDYIEFTVRDLAEAKRFYTEAVGWRFTDYGPTYAGIQGETREVGGMEQTDALRPTGGGALAILYSDDLEATLAAVVAAGGPLTQAIFSFP
ncbi:MAG: VOC family protein, partial [Bacteroidota bacterium]